MGLNLRDILLVAGETIAFVTKTNTAWIRMSNYADEREAKDAEVNTKAQQAAASALAASQDAQAANTAKQQAESSALASANSANLAARADGVLTQVRDLATAADISAKNAAISASDAARANQIAIDNAKLAVDAASAAVNAKDVVAGAIGTAAQQAATAAKLLLEQDMAGYIQQAQTAKTQAEEAQDAAAQSATSATSAASSAAQSATSAASSAAAIYDAAAHPCVYIFKTAGGQPSFFYAFPRCTWLDLMPDGSLGSSTHQAFVEDGVRRDVLYISMYSLSLKNGEVVSQPNSVPHTGMTLDEEKAICAATQLVGYTNKHRMMSIWDWSLVMHWCLASGIQPIGNTNYGKPHETGLSHIRGIAPAGTYTLTGVMGAKSSHNQTNAGVLDLVGNVWTRLDKMLLQDGRIRLYADNGSAGFVDQNLWINSNVAAGYGMPSIIASSSITVKSAGHYDYVAFSGLTGGTTLLQQATLAPLNARPANGGMWVINTGTRAPLRGGYWGVTSGAGLGALTLNNGPSDRYSSVGFRSAFVI